jgi:hypothetical protein
MDLLTAVFQSSVFWKLSFALFPFQLLLDSKYNYTDEVNVEEMDRAYSTNGAEEECIQDIGGEVRMKENTRKIKT